MIPARVRRLPLPISVLVAATAVAGCGTQGIAVPEDDPTYRGAVLFAERCSGCHTLKAAGTQGSANRALRNQGPNLDTRAVNYEDALFAIRNGGFSGAIMPQNIVVGSDAREVARFIAKWSGTEADTPPQPAGGGESQ